MSSRHIIYVNDATKASRIKQAIATCHKSLAETNLSENERNSSLYMLAYLHCLLAHHRYHKTDSFLGADLRHVQQDHYLWAAEYLSQITDDFNPLAEGLPAILASDLQYVQDAYKYQQQVHHYFLKQLQQQVKTYWFGYIQHFVKSIRKQAHN